MHKLNDNVALTCNVIGDPTPSISWTRANYSKPLTPPKFQLSYNNRSLIIINATLKERGTYICEAKNEYASDTRNVTVNLEGTENYFITFMTFFSHFSWPCQLNLRFVSFLAIPIFTVRLSVEAYRRKDPKHRGYTVLILDSCLKQGNTQFK